MGFVCVCFLCYLYFFLLFKKSLFVCFLVFACLFYEEERKCQVMGGMGRTLELLREGNID